MKIYFLFLFICGSNATGAQFQQDVALNKSIRHQPPSERAEAARMPKTFYIAAKAVAFNIKAIVSQKSTRPERKTGPDAQPLLLQAERVNENHILLQWNAPYSSTPAMYIVERRFGDPQGDFDSVGMVTGCATDPANQAYRLLDNNDFQGQTYYRIQLAGVLKKKETQMVMVRGYQQGMRVTNGGGNLSNITITLHKFKITPSTELFIRDAYGSLVYHKKNVFFINAHMLQVTGIALAKGNYHIEVVNAYNTGVNTFVIR